ncbi:MAG TPA: hypothetical protein GXZ89_06720 [Fastidiosipila sp.]|nr:hypothetical protein [Fastidiosipila sp.]
MALKEGLCVNCGSLLMLESRNEKGHCLFCDAVFDNKEAFRAKAEPDQFTFPNEPQPPYEGPNLDPRPTAVAAPAPVQPAVKSKKTTPAFVPTVTHVPDAKIPRRAKIWAITILVVALGVFAAITLPLTINRDKQRAEITDQFGKRLEQTIDLDKNLSIINMGNNHVLLTLENAVTKEEAVDIYETYCDVRASVMEKETGAAAREGVSMRLTTPEGGYLMEVERGVEMYEAYD